MIFLHLRATCLFLAFAVAALLVLVFTACRSTAQQSPSNAKTFSDAHYKIAFQYPDAFSLIKANVSLDQGGIEGIFATPDEWLVAELEMADDQYPGTDFKQANLTVTVEPKTPRQQCLDWPRAHEDDAVTRDASVDGIPFRRVESGSGAAGTQYWDITYYGHTNGTCYGIRLRLVTGGLGAVEGIKAVDRQAVMARIGSVFATIKLRPAPRTKAAAQKEPGRSIASQAHGPGTQVLDSAYVESIRFFPRQSESY